jgi:hypothetical protein
MVAIYKNCSAVAGTPVQPLRLDVLDVIKLGELTVQECRQLTKVGAASLRPDAIFRVSVILEVRALQGCL